MVTKPTNGPPRPKIQKSAIVSPTGHRGQKISFRGRGRRKWPPLANFFTNGPPRPKIQKTAILSPTGHRGQKFNRQFFHQRATAAKNSKVGGPARPKILNRKPHALQCCRLQNPLKGLRFDRKRKLLTKIRWRHCWRAGASIESASLLTKPTGRIVKGLALRSKAQALYQNPLAKLLKGNSFSFCNFSL